ncbi:MAG: hypothetical protein ABWK01_03660 [Infirmifilum sp.]
MAAHARILCKKCGSENVIAKINGEYYCAKCGMELILNHSRIIVENYEKRYLNTQ